MNCPVIHHAAETLAAHVGGLLQPVGGNAAVEAALDGLPHLPPVPGGATRQDSVRTGPVSIPDDAALL